MSPSNPNHYRYQPSANMFEPAIEQLKASGRLISQPQSFRDYIKQHRMVLKGVAPHISINRFSDLKKELREAQCTVFRLGAHQGGNNTWFSIAKTVNSWDDYFFFDRDIWGSLDCECFVPVLPDSSLLTYRIIPRLTETSLVNLAFASGLLHRALGLEKSELQAVPATGKSTFSFKFRPHSSSEQWLQHVSGQVEIDAIFTAQRQGKNCLFVIEAKSGTSLDSLSKQKLVYPILSLREMIPDDIEVVPVYLRTVTRSDGLEFNIAECEYRMGAVSVPAIDELVVRKASRWHLKGFTPSNREGG